MPYKLIDGYVRGSSVFKFGGGANVIDLHDNYWNLGFQIYSGGGNDTITVTGVNSTNPDDPNAQPGTGNLIDGGKGNDVIDSNIVSDDILIGGLGSDTIYAGGGDDWIYGADQLSTWDTAGINSLYGEEGNDTIVSSTGQDHMWGGAGADTFKISLVTGTADTIEDFNFGEGDKIDLSAYTTNFASLQLSTVNTDLVITIDGVNKLTVTGMSNSTVVQDWFLF